jgi:hypothetical protein
MMIPNELIKIIYSYIDILSFAKNDNKYEYKTRLLNYLQNTNIIDTKISDNCIFVSISDIDKLLSGCKIYIDAEYRLNSIKYFVEYYGLNIIIDEAYNYQSYYTCGNCNSSMIIIGFFNSPMCKKCLYTDQKKNIITHVNYYIKLKPQISLDQLNKLFE